MYELKNFYNGKWYRVMEFITDRCEMTTMFCLFCQILKKYI